MNPFPTLHTPRLQLRELVTQNAQRLELEVLGLLAREWSDMKKQGI
ncbi:hypothetical protein [Pseudomonas sp. 22 E 5]|nr:hypothetical protein [Pseudomonas sp. 22 E 5]